MIGIYKITNPNKRIYIGQSTNIEGRWLKYKQLSCKDQPSLYSSLKKYGPENHIFEIIEECNVEQLDEREIYWGKQYDVLNNFNLNNRLGRGFGSFDSDETKRKKSESNKGISRNKGKILSEEHKYKIKLGKLGKKYSEERNQKISKANKGKLKPKSEKALFNLRKAKNRPVLQYDLEGNFIKEWNSGKEAAISLNLFQSNINNCCRKKTKTAYNYIWEFKNQTI